MTPETPIDIYWFSGTGNTLLVARAMADVFRGAGYTVALHRIESTDPAAVDPSHIIGLAVAVAAQSTYPPVWEFLEALPEVNGTEIFLVDTLAMVSGGILGPMRSLLQRKGYSPIGAREIAMPSNFLCKSIDEDKNQAIRNSALDDARLFASQLSAGDARWRGNGPLQWIMNKFSRSSFCWTMIRKVFRLGVQDQRCIRCGLCAKLCPVENITQSNDQPPTFGHRCIACQRCFACCPVSAIHLPKKSKIKPYLAEGISAEDFLADVSNDNT